MSTDKGPSKGEKIFNLSVWEPWQVYQRIQSLDIECKCSLHQLLRVRIDASAQPLQLWPVRRQLEAYRGCLIPWLETCGKHNP
ncbi:MAG: Asr1405/Asl0597 family protein [Microcystis sp.]